MITAKEAKQIYDDTGAEVQNYLTTKIEPEVIKAAQTGLRKVTIHIDSIGLFSYLSSKITPFEKKVLNELRQLGYTTNIESYGAPYIPKGLADDDSGDPRHQNYGYIIAF